jgi:E3 ubiquitin-protein ligase UBR1
MRGQLHHYRDHPLRETTYDQDLFLLQFGFCTLDPPLMLASLIDRFGLTELFTMPIWPTQVENAQILQLLEELLLCLVTLFTETWAMQARSRVDTTKREIIHILALGPLAFSDLVKRLSERTVEIASFKDVLEEVATLRVPKGVTETGVYELKTRYYDDVNPLFYHYSRNQQNNVYEILCKQRKTDCINPTVPQLSPRLPFSALRDVFETPLIMLTCHVILHNTIEMRNRSLTAPSTPAVPQMDGLIDLVFHLTTLAVLCAPENSSAIACARSEQLDFPPLITELCDIELDKNWSPYRPRISNLIDLIAKQAPEQVRAFRARLSRDQSTVSADEARKAAIAKRKQAIMAGFAQNQVAFAEAYEVGEEDEDEAGEQMHSYGQCIVCQEACTDQRPSGLLAIVQPSKVVRNMCVGRDWLEECLRVPETLSGDTRVTRYGLGTGDRPISTDAYPRSEQRFGLNVTVCGHMMHELCLEKFFDDTRLRQHQQGQRNHPENVFRKEFVCPLCKSVGNILVPLTTASDFPSNPGYAPLNEWIRRTLDEDLKRTGKRPKTLKTHSRTGERMTWYVDVAGEAETGFLDPGQGAILIRYIMLVMAISEQTTHMSGRTERGLYVPQDVIGFTLSLMEIAQRGIAPSEQNSVYLNETSERLLRGMITLLWQEEQTAAGEPADPVLNRIAIFSTLLPERFRTKPTSSALLLRDPMTIMIEAAALAPDALQPVVVLCYFAEVVRAMLAITFWARLCLSRSASPVWSRSDVDGPEYKLAVETFPEPRNLVLSCFRHTPQLLQEATSALNLLPERDLSKLLYTFTLPFLRRASMLCSAMKTTFPVAGASDLTGEYNQHLRRLRIPAPGSTLIDPTQPIQSTAISWLKQWIQLDTGVPTLEYPGIYELYRIPESLEDLLRFYEKKECTRCGKVPSTPAVCMFCGEYLCLGTDCCSEGSMGECNTHRME